MTRPITSILFDLDGTLADTVPGIQYACQAAVEAILPGRSIPDLHGRIGPPIGEILGQVLPEADANTLGEIEVRFRSCYDSVGWSKSMAYSGVAGTMEQLAIMGVRCFVVTNKPNVPTRKILKHLGIDRFLETPVSPDSKMPPFASKADLVCHVMAHHRLDPETTLLVGDSNDDAQAALACGLAFAAVSYGYGQAYTQVQIFRVVLSRFDQILELFSTPSAGIREDSHD